MTDIFVRIFILAICIQVATLTVLANETRNQEDPPQPHLSIEELVPLLENSHQVNIFFRSRWFAERKFAASLVDLSLDDALRIMLEGSSLRVVQIDDNVIFVPRESGVRTATSQGGEGQRVIVGNPDDYGKYTRAVISGTIYDGTLTEPLFGAGVFEPISRTGVTTDFDGKFSLELPVGDYRLRYSYMGYEDRYQDIRLVGDGTLTMELFPSATQLREVTVMARLAEQNITRTQMSLINMDAKAIKELPQTFGERDIVRSITLLPGVQTVGEFGTGFNVRGGSADQNLILLENVPIFNSSHMFGLISVINPDIVNNVSLMKAGIPARYGERASSIMDIRLINANTEESIAFSGGIGLLNSRLLVKAPIVENRASFSLAGRSSYSDWFIKRMPDEDLMNSEAGFYDLTAVSNIVLTDKSHFTLFGYYSHDNFRFSEDADFQYSNVLASLRWNRYINERWDFTSVLGMSRYDYNVAETPATRPLDHFTMNSKVDYLTARMHFSYTPNERNNFEFGASGIKYDILPGHQLPFGQESTFEEVKIERESALELSAFVSNDFQVTERLSIDAGLRFTQYYQLGEAEVYQYADDLPITDASITDTLTFGRNDVVKAYNGLEPRLGMRYILGDNSSVKISYNRNNQYINLITNTAVMTPADIWKLSDYHLKPLQSDQYALGYFHNFFENTLETSFEMYYKTLNNAIEYKSGAEIFMNETLEQDVVNARGYNYGFEFYVNKNSGIVTGWTSYTYSSSMRRSTTEFEKDQINRNTWFPSNYDRPHNLVLNLNYNISRRWRLGGTFSYSTGRPVTLPEHVYSYGNEMLISYSDRNKYRLPDYHRLDISLSYGESLKLNQRGKGSWTISLMNVYGRKNPYSVFYKKDPAGLNRGQSFNLYQLYIIGRPLPTITYNFSF